MGYNVVDCNVEKCVHNMEGMCNAENINIMGYNSQNRYFVGCHTFEAKNFKTSITNITNINIMGAVDQIFAEEQVMNPEIKCSALECVYNQNMICHADSIFVNGPDATTVYGTTCKTFKKRM